MNSTERRVAKQDSSVPAALRSWFVVHFVADMLFALPLFFAPEQALTLVGWLAVDPITTRLVGAALFGIGIESYLGRNADRDRFRGMLNLKVIWSATASIGIAWSMFEGAHDRPVAGWLFLATFVAFHALWVYWRIRLGRSS
ncbi:MAG TPA: hypothetical protein DCQ06_00285 [Myxococcales bacterium]|nr:hypothetical protein [Myxococcales bacterium]